MQYIAYNVKYDIDTNNCEIFSKSLAGQICETGSMESYIAVWRQGVSRKLQGTGITWFYDVNTKDPLDAYWTFMTKFRVSKTLVPVIAGSIAIAVACLFSDVNIARDMAGM